VGVVAFIGSYLVLFPSGCDSEGGVPSWEQCTTLMGTPAFSLTDWGLDNTFDILIPLMVATLAAAVAWWLSGLMTPDRT
jgi:hypothetical protein